MSRYEIVNIVCTSVNATVWAYLCLRLIQNGRLLREMTKSNREMMAVARTHTIAIREFVATIKRSPYFHEDGPTPPTVQ